MMRPQFLFATRIAGAACSSSSSSAVAAKCGFYASAVSSSFNVLSSPFLVNAARTQMIGLGGKAYHRTGPKKASTELPMSPELAEQCNQLAKTAFQTRNLKDALSLYDRVLSYREKADGPRSERYCATLFNVGRVLVELKNFKGAEQALTEVCAIYEDMFGEGNLKYADALGQLATVYVHLELFDEAEAAFKSALLAYRENVFNHEKNSWLPGDPDTRQPPDEPNESPLATVAHLLSDASLLFTLQDQLERAAAFLEEALEIRRFLYSKHAKFRPMIAQTLSKLAEIKRALNDIEIAEMYINECVQISVETLGRDSPATAACISSKGNILSMKRKFIEAKKCYEEAATTYAMAFGKASPLVGLEMIHIGRSQELMNDFIGADNNYQKGIDIAKASLGADNVQVADALQHRASLAMRKLDFSSATPMLREAIRIRGLKASATGKTDLALASLYHKLGDALAAQRDPEAEAQFLQSVEVHRSVGKAVHDLMATDVLDDLGLHYIQFKHYSRARECFTEALEIRDKQFKENHPTVGYSHSNLSVLAMNEGKYDECEKECLKAMEVYDRLKQDDTWMAIADVRSQLGQCYRAQKKLDQALEQLERCLNMRRVKGEQTDVAVAETLHHLALVRMDKGENDEAEKCATEAMALCDKHASAAAPLKEELVKVIQKLKAAKGIPA